MVVEQVRDLGVDLILGKMVNKILTDENHCVTGVEFKDGDTVEGACVCFAVSAPQMCFEDDPDRCHRLEYHHVMIWPESPALKLDLVVALLWETTYKPPSKTSTRSANVQTGQACATVSTGLALKWPISLHST